MTRMPRAACARCSTAPYRGLCCTTGHGSFPHSLEAGNSSRVVGLFSGLLRGLSEDLNSTNQQRCAVVGFEMATAGG